MSRLRIIVQRIDEDSNKCTNVDVLSSHDFEMLDLPKLPKEDVVDKLESDTMNKGWEVMQSLFVKQLELADKALSITREHKESKCKVRFEGHKPIKIVSRLGILEPERQLCECEKCGEHFIPLNEIIPEHKGIIVSKGVREWACLLPQELPFNSVARLMGWMSHEEKLLSKNTIREMVKEEGESIREAEKAEVERLTSSDNLSELKAKVIPHKMRRMASWPKEVTEAVEEALKKEEPEIPAGMSKADWERILENKKEGKTTIEELRRLGPKPKDGQVVVSTDEVLVRATKKKSFHDIKTAKVVISEGYRYFSGVDAVFLQRLHMFILLNTLKNLPSKELVLDWYHLMEKFRKFSSMICKGKIKKAKFLGFTIPCLWVGNWEKVINYLRDYRKEARNIEKLEELITYMEKNEEAILNYKERRKSCQYNGSGAVEKANDLLVSRRQKKKGMHWGVDTSLSLATLKTLVLNQAWEEYWNSETVLALAG